MKRKILIGLMTGAAAGAIDIIPMLIQKLPPEADISAFTMWVVVGFFLAVSDFKVKGAVKGLIISFLVLLPCSIIIGWKEPLSLLPIMIMTIILGSLAGYLFEKLTKES